MRNSAHVAEGALLNACLTSAAVLLILWFALRSRRIIFAVPLSLFVGLAVTAAVGLATRRRAQPYLDGLRRPVRRHRRRFRHSVLGAVPAGAPRQRHLATPSMPPPRAIAKPLTLAAAATAAGFYAFLPTDYRGVSELGLDRRHRHDHRVSDEHHASCLRCWCCLSRRANRTRSAIAGLAPVDRFMARHRLPILVLAGVAVAAGLPLFSDLSFDFNPINLRSAKVELVATLLDLMKDPATTPNTIDVLAPSLRRRRRRWRSDSTSCRKCLALITLKSFVPEDQEEKLAIIQDAADSARANPRAARDHDPGPDRRRDASRRSTRPQMPSAANKNRAADFGSSPIARSLEGTGGGRCRTSRRHRRARCSTA